jgi:hypothetical protein
VDEDILLLEALARSGTPTGAIALKLGRTKAAISIKASKLGLKLGERSSPAEPIRGRIDNAEERNSGICGPSPQSEWTSQQVADYDSLTKQHSKLCAEFAELVVRRSHKQR